MTALCLTVSEMVSAYLGVEVGVGPSTLRDPNVMHLLINAFPESSPAGSTIITIGFYRAGHVNPLLTGPAPFLLGEKRDGEKLSGREVVGLAAKRILERVRGYLMPPVSAPPPEPRRID